MFMPADATSQELGSSGETGPENPRLTYIRDLESHFQSIPGMAGITLPNSKRDGKLYTLTPTYGEDRKWTKIRIEPTKISDDGYEFIELSGDNIKVIQVKGSLTGNETQEELLEIARNRFEEVMEPIRRERERQNSHSIAQ